MANDTPSDNLIKSKKRVADHGEVFTPPGLVEKILNLLMGETERIDSRILEPACGSGNFKVFNTERMNAAVFAFRRYEDASLRYTASTATMA